MGFKNNNDANNARVNIFENKKYLKTFSSRDFSKNIIFAENVYVDINSQSASYKNTNCLIGQKEDFIQKFIPANIMQLNTSFIIKDYNGEVLIEYEDFLRDKGYIVKTINFMDTKKSLSYNIFDFLNYEEDVNNFVDMVIKANIVGLSKSDLLLKKAESLFLKSIIYYIMLELPYEEQNMSTLLKLLFLAKPKSEIGKKYESDVDMLFRFLEKDKDAEDNIALVNYKEFLLAAKNMEGIIIENVEKYLAIYNVDSISKITRYNTLKIDDIFARNKKVALFIVVPMDNDVYEYMADMLVSQLINYLQYVAERKYSGSLPNKVHIISNNIIHNQLLELIEESYSLNLILSVCIEDISKMMNYYENVYEVIDECSVQVFYEIENEDIRRYINYRIVETYNIDIDSDEHKLKEEEFDVLNYLTDKEKEKFLVFLQYAKVYLGEEYQIDEPESYVKVDSRTKKYKIDEFKSEAQKQIYRNLLSAISENEKNIKLKENVSVDIAGKLFVNDEMYENISTKVNKKLLKEV